MRHIKNGKEVEQTEIYLYGFCKFLNTIFSKRVTKLETKAYKLIA